MQDFDVEYPIRATAYSEIMNVNQIKGFDHKTKVCTIELDSKVRIITNIKDIDVFDICIFKEPLNGDIFTIQFVDENEEVIEDIYMSENMIKLLALAIVKYKET